jgi:hypothetical protein
VDEIDGVASAGCEGRQLAKRAVQSTSGRLPLKVKPGSQHKLGASHKTGVLGE